MRRFPEKVPNISLFPRSIPGCWTICLDLILGLEIQSHAIFKFSGFNHGDHSHRNNDVLSLNCLQISLKRTTMCNIWRQTCKGFAKNEAGKI